MSLQTHAMVSPLDFLHQMVAKGTMEKIIEHEGQTYTMRSLFDEDYNWRDRFGDMSGPMSFSSSLRAPTLALAVVAINGVGVGDISELSAIDTTMPAAAQELIRAEPKFHIAYNLYQLFKKMPRQFVLDLYTKFVEEVEKPSRTVTGDDVKNS